MLSRLLTVAIAILGITALVVGGIACKADGPKRKVAEKKYWGPRYAPEEAESDGEAGEGGDPDQGFGPTGGAMDLANAGSIKGVFKFKGAALKPRKFDLTKDAWCVSNAKEILSEEFVIDANGNVANAVAYIELGMKKQSFAVPTTPARLVQRNCRYVPHVLALRAQQELQIENADSTSHNYKLTSSKNGTMNETQSRPQTDSKYLNKAELDVSFNCDVHPWMLARLHLFDHDYFAVSAVDGGFELKNVPPGRYKIGFRHEKWKSASIEIVVGPKETKDLGEIVLQ